MRTDIIKTALVFLICTFCLTTVFTQSPEKMSYQAIVRNSSDALVSKTQIGMQISILQGTADGTPVYIETHTPTTNANGLVSIEMGSGTILSGIFSAIDWANGPFFLKTEIAVTAPLTTYTITGTSQLLSVPYALHAKTADIVSGGIKETDPVFGASVASEIEGTDIANWNNKLDIESDPVFTNWDKSTGITIVESQISDLGTYLDAESDPIFGASVASEIEGTDITNWNNKLDIESDPVFTNWDKSTGITIVESQISDLGTYLEAESDPIFGASVASEIEGTDITNWNNKLDIESDPVFTNWDKSAGITIVESQISDLGTYLEAESDPIFGASVASEIEGTDIANWNNKLDIESDPVFTNWDKSAGITIVESQISDLGTYLEAESDPIFGASPAKNITNSDITKLSSLSGTNTGDQTLTSILGLNGNAGDNSIINLKNMAIGRATVPVDQLLVYEQSSWSDPKPATILIHSDNMNDAPACPALLFQKGYSDRRPSAGIFFNRVSFATGDLIFALQNNLNHNVNPVSLSDERMRIKANGNVGIGVDPISYKLDVNGYVNSSFGYLTAGADYAEYFEIEGQMEVGDIAGVNPETGYVRKYVVGDLLIGIVSKNPGFIGNNAIDRDKDTSYALIGITGQLEFNRGQVDITNRLVKTKDGHIVGILLANNKVFIR
jgi:hypothetical protein